MYCYICFSIWRFPISRAFVKEQDGDDLAEDLPERIHSDAPNYITPAGERRLRLKLRLLGESYENLNREKEHLGKKGDLQRLDRDIKYYQERLHRAIPVEQTAAPYDRVLFGMSVSLQDSCGNEYEFTIVGEDEADLNTGKISWTSPLGQALLQREVGETLVWIRPAGDLELEVAEINYRSASN